MVHHYMVEPVNFAPVRLAQAAWPRSASWCTVHARRRTCTAAAQAARARALRVGYLHRRTRLQPHSVVDAI